MLRSLGYATGQFGKNHLGDRDEHLPTQHGFDEFFGNLYHLKRRGGARTHRLPRRGRLPELPRELRAARRAALRRDADGTQTIEDTGPLTRKRMETIDDEIVDGAVDFIDRRHADGGPFFLWVNTTHMHFRTHTKPESRGQAGRWQSPYHDSMIDHDRHVGRVLDKLDALGIAEDTIVVYSTDNGPHMNSWPDGAMTPFRGEKNTNWEGAFRVPQIVRWPRRIAAGTVSNEIISHLDWLPTLASAAGEPTPSRTSCSEGTRWTARASTCTSTATTSWPTSPARPSAARVEFFYFSDDGDLVALRYDNWKLVFMEQRVSGTLQVWFEPFVVLRAPRLYNLRTDPYERADVTSNTYWDWYMDRIFLVVPAQGIVAEFLQTFLEFPPRQKAASFTIDQVQAKIEAAIAGGR